MDIQVGYSGIFTSGGERDRVASRMKEHAFKIICGLGWRCARLLFVVYAIIKTKRTVGI